MKYLFQGFILGLAYVAPIGLQNLFVINTALTKKLKRALMTALVVIFFDVTLAFASFYGVGALMEKSKILQLAILLIGGLIVIYIGFGLIKDTLNKNVSMKGNTDVDIPFSKVITSACVVTWFNPQAIIDGSMMLGAFRASLPIQETTKFILGVTGASATWFLSITILISLFHNLFNDKVLRVINGICGVVIIIYGVKLLYNFIQALL
ncbi:LysE family transporter [Fusobacterium hominis]|jgi:L-lysine exporter family protein LysE/ArgO|uniref:LysE family transporter n=1 Tax=Fusobacterium hominis TaxID=2764326 RepID=A0A7G9GW06_9FUSO|nr:LysE family transporter [Fusobacterium hominis]QNM14988.1 LysE family transporter [Fusobacterium hominis]